MYYLGAKVKYIIYRNDNDIQNYKINILIK